MSQINNLMRFIEIYVFLSYTYFLIFFYLIVKIFLINPQVQLEFIL